jgi:DNA-binding MarR family transcriptional regulator
MQVISEKDVAAHLDRLITEQLPGGRGVEAWRALIQAHATLMRQLDMDLQGATGLDLGHFDVLAQLAGAGGALRMTDLAARAFTSRSGLTRRVAQLVGDGLLRRSTDATDGRAVVVALTDAGLERLSETVPVHLRGVSDLFVSKLDDRELALLETALGKVSIDCNFG